MRWPVPHRTWLVTVLAAVLVGCSKTEAPAPYAIPETNDATCAKAAIEAMPISDELRREFGSKCARRGSYNPSSPKAW